jgi:hypothetical protein
MKLLIGLFFLCTLQFANAINFKFSDKNESYEKVIFSNKDILQIERKDKDNWLGQKLSLIQKSKKKPGIENIEGDILDFVYAYPSITNARIAVLLSTCSGSACFPFIHVAYVEDDQLIIHDLGATYYNDNLNFDFNFINNKVSLVANNVNTFRKNSYGDTIHTKMTLLNKIGFVDGYFNKKYLKILDVHPEIYFSNIELREILAKKIGLDKFRALRENMTVAINTYITQGHFIVMEGCMPHSCNTNAGIVVLDTEKEIYYAVLVDKNSKKIETNSTSTWNDGVAELIRKKLIDSQFKVEIKNNKFIFQN